MKGGRGKKCIDPRCARLVRQVNLGLHSMGKRRKGGFGLAHLIVCSFFLAHRLTHVHGEGRGFSIVLQQRKQR
jgi:hypothetical protein